MTSNELVIKLLSKTGQVQKTVACHVGQVSVFRSSSEYELRAFGMALFGMPGAQKFSISLDGETFNPANHCFIGFGERFETQDLTLKQYLIDAGVSRTMLDPLIEGAGLLGKANQSLNSLDAAETRAARLLAASSGQYLVLVLNDPFGPLSTNQREFFAQLMLDSAQVQQQIVIVTELSSRPECWINNPIVIRVDLSRRQPTIGFGAEGFDMQTLVKRVQEAVSETGKQAESGLDQGGFLTRTSRRRLLVLCSVLALLCVIVVINWFVLRVEVDARLAKKGDIKNEDVVVPGGKDRAGNHLQQYTAPTPLNQKTDLNSNPALVPLSGSTIPETQVEAMPTLIPTLAPTQIPTVAPTPENDKVLALYDQEIQDSVRAAFVQTGSDDYADESAFVLSRDSESGSNTAIDKKLKSKQAGELLGMLELANDASDSKKPGNAAGTYDNRAEQAEPNNQPDNAAVDWEAEREQMRQRFLQAIESSQEQQ